MRVASFKSPVSQCIAAFFAIWQSFFLFCNKKYQPLIRERLVFFSLAVKSLIEMTLLFKCPNILSISEKKNGVNMLNPSSVVYTR